MLFVSHNMGAITRLCPRSLLVRSGELEVSRDSETTVRMYLSSSIQKGADMRFDPLAEPSKAAMLTRCWIADRSGKLIDAVSVGSAFAIYLEVLVREMVPDSEISVRVYSRHGEPLFTTNLSSQASKLATLRVGMHTFAVEVPPYFLAPDTYSLHVGIHRPNVLVLDAHDHVLSFVVEESGSDMWQYYQAGCGSILVHFPWRHMIEHKELTNEVPTEPTGVAGCL